MAFLSPGMAWQQPVLQADTRRPCCAPGGWSLACLHMQEEGWGQHAALLIATNDDMHTTATPAARTTPASLHTCRTMAPWSFKATRGVCAPTCCLAPPHSMLHTGARQLPHNYLMQPMTCTQTHCQRTALPNTLKMPTSCAFVRRLIHQHMPFPCLLCTCSCRTLQTGQPSRHLPRHQPPQLLQRDTPQLCLRPLVIGARVEGPALVGVPQVGLVVGAVVSAALASQGGGGGSIQGGLRPLQRALAQDQAKQEGGDAKGVLPRHFVEQGGVDNACGSKGREVV